LLQPRDRLLIHKNTSRVEPSTIEITGEVAKPGRYPYTENMRAEDLIRAAGGFETQRRHNHSRLDPLCGLRRLIATSPDLFGIA